MLFSQSAAALLAQLNHFVIFCSVSPTYLPLKSAAVGVKNNTWILLSRFCSSLIAAFMRYVFPVPGGPYNKNPLPGSGYKFGYKSGSIKVSVICFFATADPAKSLKNNFIFGLARAIAIHSFSQSFVSSSSLFLASHAACFDCNASCKVDTCPKANCNMFAK